MTKDCDTQGAALEQGDSTDYYQCDVCGSPTLNTAIPLRHSDGDGTGAGTAVQLRACDSCQFNLANVAWGDRI